MLEGVAGGDGGSLWEVPQLHEVLGLGRGLRTVAGEEGHTALLVNDVWWHQHWTGNQRTWPLGFVR